MIGNRMRWIVISAVVVARAVAQDPTPREAELIDLVERLERRVVELEAKVEQLEKSDVAPGATGDLVERVDRLEAAAEESLPAPNDLRVYWDEGLHMETADEQFKLSVGGRIHIDHAWFDQDRGLRYVLDWDAAELRPLDLQNGTEFRFARLHVKGLAYGNIEYQAEFDFADGGADVKDTYIAYLGAPYIGDVWIGHFKEPFSLIELASDNNVVLMERPLPTAFAPSRNMGIAIKNSLWDERATYALGVFRDTDDTGTGLNDGGYAVTGRLTGLPWTNEDRSALIHLGASYSWRDTDDVVRFSADPEAHLSSWDFVDTGDFYANEIRLWGAEVAGKYGPFAFQSEYIAADADADFRGQPDFDGWYAQASYILTGESMEYKSDEGIFGMVNPDRPFRLTGDSRGWGAWELALRYSTIDLTDRFFRGGEEHNWALGLNWHLNANTRIRLNYVRAHIDHDLYDGDVTIVQTRFQFHF